MKFIIVGEDGVVYDCLAEYVDGAIPVTDGQAASFRTTRRHSELSYIDGELVPTPPRLADLKVEKYAAVTAKRISVAEGGLTFGGGFVPTDKEAVVIINAAREAYKRNPGRPPVKRAGIGTLDSATLDLLFDAIDNLWTAAFDRECDLYDAIEASETIEALDAIDIESGW
jgi:hypothetical protein